jgi:hypothetical protein
VDLAQAELGIEKPVLPSGKPLPTPPRSMPGVAKPLPTPPRSMPGGREAAVHIAEVDAEGRETDDCIAEVDAGGRESDPQHRKTDVDIAFSMLAIEEQIPDIAKTTTDSHLWPPVF